MFLRFLSLGQIRTRVFILALLWFILLTGRTHSLCEGSSPIIAPQEEATKPPSLKNIYLELYKDKEVEFSCLPKSGDLSSWGEQGVLLLNASLTVRQSKSNSHYKYWQELTDNLIKFISNEKENVIFVLWGNFAKQKKIPWLI